MGMSDIEHNTTFTVLARLAMLFASVIGLPVAGYLLVRGINTMDRTELGIHGLTIRAETLQYQLNNVAESLKDHEIRIRVLEKPPIVVQPAVPLPAAPLTSGKH